MRCEMSNRFEFTSPLNVNDPLVNCDVIIRGEGVELARIGDAFGEREFEELFKCQIRFSLAFLVAEILTVKETPLFSVFF